MKEKRKRSKSVEYTFLVKVVKSFLLLFINILIHPTNKDLINKNFLLASNNTKLIFKGFSDWIKSKANFLIPAVAVIFFSGFIFNLHFTIDTANIFTLLSTISAGLAGVLAIILSVSLVATQLASRYSSRVFSKIFLKPSIILYIIIFILGIIFPLMIFIIDSSYYIISIRISLILTFICLIYLLPFLITLSEWIRLKNIIYELYVKSTKKIKDNYGKFPDEIITLHEIATSSWTNRNYEGFRNAIEALTNIIIDIAICSEETKVNEDEATEQQDSEVKNIPFFIDQLLMDLRQLSVLVKDDSIASNRLIEELIKGAIEIESLNITKDKKDNICEEMLEEMWIHAKRIATRDDMFTFEKYSYLLSGLGGQALVKSQLTTTKRIFRCLQNMFFISINKGWNKAARQVIFSIHSMGRIAIDKGDTLREIEPKGKEAFKILEICFIGVFIKYIYSSGKKSFFDRALEINYKMVDLVKNANEKNSIEILKIAIIGFSKNMERVIKFKTKNPNVDVNDFLTIILESLLRTIEYAVEKSSKEVAKMSLKALITICLKSAKDNPSIVKKIIPFITTVIGRNVVMEKELELVQLTINKFIILAKEIHEINEFFTTIIASQLWILGGCAEKMFPQGRNIIKSGLCDLGILIGRTGLEIAFEKVENWFPPSFYLYEFKRYFEEL